MDLTPGPAKDQERSDDTEPAKVAWIRQALEDGEPVQEDDTADLLDAYDDMVNQRDAEAAARRVLRDELTAVRQAWQGPNCPECVPGAASPHTEPDLPHIHLTAYGYLIYAPTHEHCDFLEEMRAVAYRAGYGQGRDDEAAGKDMPSWT